MKREQNLHRNNFLIELEILRFPSGDADNSLKHWKKNHTTSKVRYGVLDKYENLYNLINGIDLGVPAPPSGFCGCAVEPRSQS